MAISVRRYHLWVRKVQKWWRAVKAKLDDIAKDVEDSFVAMETKILAKQTGYPWRVGNSVRKKFVKGELRSRRYRHLAFLEHFEREYSDYRRQVEEYRVTREALIVIYKPVQPVHSGGDSDEDSEDEPISSVVSPGASYHNRTSEVWGEDIGYDKEEEESKKRNAKPAELTEEQIACLKALKAVPVPVPPFYVSYIPHAKDERTFEDIVNRCTKDPENTLPLHDNRSRSLVARKNSASSENSDAMDFMDKDDVDENLEIEPTRSAAFPRPPVETSMSGFGAW